MTSDAILVVQCLFSTIWSLFTSWYIPGTNVTPAQFFLFLGSASLGITFIVRLLMVNPSVPLKSVKPDPYPVIPPPMVPLPPALPPSSYFGGYLK